MVKKPLSWRAVGKAKHNSMKNKKQIIDCFFCFVRVPTPEYKTQKEHMKKINVALTDEKFKRLALKIKKALPSSGLKLGQVQEMVAQSFGFRNLSGLLNAMGDEEKMSTPKVGMERVTKEKLLHLYEWFAPSVGWAGG
jgi:hypothetical protein